VTAAWLLLNYVLVIATGSLRPGLFASLSIAFGCVFVVHKRYWRVEPGFFRLNFGAIVCFVLGIGLLGISSLLDPITAWDA
jgi:hypothetical protein